MARGVTIVITVLFSWWGLLQGIDLEENWRACTTQDLVDTRFQYFCGWELGDNYTRHTVYSCSNLTPEIDTECKLNIYGGDVLCPSIWCRRLRGNSKTRACYPITSCIPQRDFCGFKDLAEVRGIINRTIKSKPHIRNRQHHLDEAIKRGEED